MPFDVKAATDAGYSPAQIADEVGRAAGFDTAGARAHGYSDQQIIQELANRPAPGGSSWIGDLRGGLHDLGTSISQGANALGFEGAGKAIEGITPDAPAGPSPGEDVAENLRQGNVGAALSAVPHAALRALPSVAPILGAGLLGGPVAAGAAAGALSVGPGAYARAAENNRATPNASDVVGGALNAIPQAVLGAALPGGAAARIASPLARAAARTGMAAAAGGGMSAANQLGTSIGTERGASVDPAEVGAAALTQGALGGGIAARDLAQQGVKAGVDNMVARTLPTPDDPTARSIVRVTSAMKDVQDQRAAAGQPITAPAAAAAVKDAHFDALQRVVRTLRDTDSIDKTDYGQIQNSIDAAKVGKNTVTRYQLEHIRDLDGVPEATRAFIIENLLDLNTASSQSFLKNETGPFQKAGNVVGRVAGMGLAAASGNPYAMAASVMGNRLEGQIGSAGGMMLDRLFGTNTPPVVLQRINAMKALRAAGVDPTGIQPMALPTLPQLPRPSQPTVMTVGGGRQPQVPVVPQGFPTAPQPQGPPVPPPPGPIGGARAPQAPGVVPPGVPLAPQLQGPPVPPAPGAIGGGRPAQVPGVVPPGIPMAPQQFGVPMPPPPGPMGGGRAAQVPGVVPQGFPMQRPNEVGNLPDPVPVNTRIPASAPVPPAPPPAVSALTTLRPNTPQDVRETIALDDALARRAPEALQAAQAPAGTPTPATPQTASQPAPSGAMKFIKNGLPGMTHDQIVAALQAHEAAGTIPPGTVADLLVSPKTLEGEKYQRLAIGLPPEGSGNQGFAVEHSVQARINAQEYQNNARAYAQQHPDIAVGVMQIAQAGKSPAQKRAIATAYTQAHPEALGRFPEWLLNHGFRG